MGKPTRLGRSLTAGGASRRDAKILSVATMIGFVAVERQASLLRCVPSPLADAAHQFGVRFDAKSDQIRERPYRIGVSAGGLTVVCDQTQTFVTNHSF